MTMVEVDRWIRKRIQRGKQAYIEDLEGVYKCFPSSDCYKCPFSLDYSRSTIKKLQKEGVHWHCSILDKYIIKRACTKELILKKILEVV